MAVTDVQKWLLVLPRPRKHHYKVLAV